MRNACWRIRKLNIHLNITSQSIPTTYNTTKIGCQVIRKLTIHHSTQWSQLLNCRKYRTSFVFRGTLHLSSFIIIIPFPTFIACRSLLSVSPSKLFVLIQQVLEAFSSPERRKTKSAGNMSPSLTLTISPTRSSPCGFFSNSHFSLFNTSTREALTWASARWRFKSSRTKCKT